jgi:plastocyanin
MGVVVVAALLLLAGCQASGSGTPQTFRTAAPTGTADALPSATPSPTTSPTAAIPSPTATSTDDSSSPAGAAVDPRKDGLDVAFGEFAITLEAEAIRPGPVTLVVHNAGQLTHGFEMKIEGGSGSGGDRKKIETRTFRSGETLRVEADLAPGVYEIECYVANHASMGMRTTLEVRANAPLVSAAPGTAASGDARIVQFAFVPASLDVPVGSRVTWTNGDPTPHTVTADGGAFDSKQLDPGASFSVALDTPGSFKYHCEIHPTMVGTVVVH